MYTLGTAAKATGVSKTSIHRAIRKGRISATRQDDGSYIIDPAELHRVFPPVTAETGDTNSEPEQTVTGPGTAVTPELAILNARLEAEIAGLRELLRNHRDQIDDLRNERDRLLGQVETAHRLLTDQRPRPGLFGRLFRRAG